MVLYHFQTRCHVINADITTVSMIIYFQISFCRNSKSEQDTVIKSVTEEIHMMSKLSHPNIIRIMGATRQGCHFNMFVEWMPGKLSWEPPGRGATLTCCRVDAR